jgi:hypothetical protein
MPFDLRLPIGLMFGLYGLILTGVGLFGGPQLMVPTLGINMNLDWGLVLLVFALLMLASWKWGNRRPPGDGR